MREFFSWPTFLRFQKSGLTIMRLATPASTTTSQPIPKQRPTWKSLGAVRNVIGCFGATQWSGRGASDVEIGAGQTPS